MRPAGQAAVIGGGKRKLSFSNSYNSRLRVRAGLADKLIKMIAMRSVACLSAIAILAGVGFCFVRAPWLTLSVVVGEFAFAIVVGKMLKYGSVAQTAEVASDSRTAA